MDDRLQFLMKRLKVVSRYVCDRVGTYYDSHVYKSLERRIKKLNDMIDMQYDAPGKSYRRRNNWRSNISMPMVRESYLAVRASLSANFRNDPLLTPVPTGDSSPEQAEKAGMVLEGSLRESRFREWAFREGLEHVSRFGVAVQVPKFIRQDSRYMVTQPKRMMGQIVGTERTEQRKRKAMVRNYPVQALNYFQDANVVNPYDSPFQGYIDRVTLAELLADVQESPENYIKENVRKVIEECKKDGIRDENYWSPQGENNDWDAVGVDVRHYFGVLSIEGNERDGRDYYVEMVGDTIIRLQLNPWDYGIRPITILTVDKRYDRWYGNTPCEGSVPAENYLSLVLGMAADQGLRELQNYIFYNRALGIDPADINNRAINGGFVPMDIKPDQRPQDMFYMFSPSAGNLNNFQWIIGEVKEANQRLQPKADLQRKANQGGLQNATATAAMQISEEGDIQQNFYLHQFGDCLRELGHKNLVILMQMLPEQFMVRRSPTDAPQMVEKAEILGEYGLEVHSTLTKNKQLQLMNLFNVLTAIQNFKGSGAPTYQAIQDGRLVRKWLQTALPDEDIDRIAPPELMEQPPQQPGATMAVPGMPPAGGAPMGAPPPVGVPPAAPAAPTTPPAQQGVMSAQMAA